MEVSRRSENGPVRCWDSSLIGLSNCKTSELENSLIVLPDREDGFRPTEVKGSPARRQSQRVTTTSDVIDGLLEAFQSEWMTLRPNGRIQSDTIWRNGIQSAYVFMNVPHE